MRGERINGSMKVATATKVLQQQQQPKHHHSVYGMRAHTWENIIEIITYENTRQAEAYAATDDTLMIFPYDEDNGVTTIGGATAPYVHLKKRAIVAIDGNLLKPSAIALRDLGCRCHTPPSQLLVNTEYALITYYNNITGDTLNPNDLLQLNCNFFNDIDDNDDDNNVVTSIINKYIKKF